MKTWITYIAAVALGFSATLLLGEFELYKVILDAIAPILMDFGIFMLFPSVAIMCIAGISSLRRHARTGLMIGTTLLWSVATAVFLSAATLVIHHFLPFSFEHIAIAESGSTLPGQITNISGKGILSMAFGENAFAQLITTHAHLLPIIVVAILIGYSLKPNIEVIRPAYVVMNSFSEAMFRLARFFAVIGALLVGLLAARYVYTVQIETLILQNLQFFMVVVIALIASLFIILPLLYAIVTGFSRGNPYRILFGCISSMIAAFITGNHLFSTMVLLPTSRRNNQVQKRIAGTTLPIYTIIGKGGSAMIATITMLTMITTVTGSAPNWKTGALIAGICVMFSYLSSWNLGFESIFIVLAAMKFLQIDMGGMELAIIPLLPILSGIAVLVDTAIGAFGAAYTSRMIVTPVATPYRDLI